jgi:hypothetical protein
MKKETYLFLPHDYHFIVLKCCLTANGHFFQKYHAENKLRSIHDYVRVVLDQ